MAELEPRYPQKRALILPALHAAQEEHGWLSKDVMNEIADYFSVTHAQIREVASFYTMFNLKPVGKNHLRICTNVACCLRGADDLMAFAEKKLGVKCGETTPDGYFTLSEEECLGACTTAPVMMANDDYIEALDVNKLNDYIESKKVVRHE